MERTYTRNGITPVVAVVLLLMMTAAAAGGTYTYLTGTIQEGQEQASESLATRLEVKDVQCYGTIVVAYLKNEGGTVLSTTDMDAYVYEENTLLNDTTVDISGKGFRQPGGIGRVDIDLGTVLNHGRQHSVRFDLPADDHRVEATCDAQNALVGYWQFDEGSGTWANDTVGTAGDGRLKNGSTICSGGDCPQWDSGIRGGGIHFDGMNDRVEVSYTVENRSGTVAFWIRPDWSGTDGNQWNLFTIGNPGNDGLLLRKQSGNFINYETYNNDDCSDSGYCDLDVSTTSWNSGTWTHVAITWADGTKEVYVNGTLEGSNGPNTFATPSGIIIGDRNGPAANAVFDEVRLYDERLSAGHIAGLYNATQ